MATLRNWSLEQLKTALNQSDSLKGWIINQEHVHRRERYFMMGKSLIVDQDRDTHRMSIQVKLFVKLAAAGRQGEITKLFFPSLGLQEQLLSAIEAAKQTDHQAWDLPIVN